MTADDFDAEQITAMRAWIAECSWSDLDSEDIDYLPDSIVVWGVDHHYDGGIEAFLRDIAPQPDRCDWAGNHVPGCDCGADEGD